MLDLFLWSVLGARIVAGSALVLILALVLRRLARRGGTERTIWQAGVVVIGLFLVSELTGINLGSLGKQREGLVENSTRLELKAEFKERVRTDQKEASLSEREANIQSIESASPVTWPLLVWVTGTTLFWLLRMTQTAICMGVRRQSVLIKDGLLNSKINRLASEMGVGSRIKIYQSYWYKTPVAFGLWRPSIGLPEGFEGDFSAEEQEAILAHELAHLTRHDPGWRLVVDTICAFCWWNPFAWILRKYFLEACELAADEESARISNGEVLANALVMVANRIKPGAAGNWSGMAGRGYRSNLGRRVTRLLESRGTIQRKRAWELLTKAGAGLSLLMAVLIGLALLEQRVNALGALRGLSPVKMALSNWSADNREAVEPTDVSRNETLVNANPSDSSEKETEPTKVTDPVVKPLAKEDLLAQGRNNEEKLIFPALEREAEKPEPKTQQGPLLQRLETPVEKFTYLGALSGGPPQNLETPVAKQDERAVVEPKIKIEAKWVEVKNLSFDPIRELGMETLGIEADKSTTAEAKLIRIEQGNGWTTNNLPGAKISGPYRIKLANEAYGDFLRALEIKPEVDLTGSPNVTTVSGRQARISISETQTIVTGFATNKTSEGKERLSLRVDQMEFGISLDVIPRVEKSGEISITIEGTAREFMGYEDPGPRGQVEVWDNEKRSKAKVPLPGILERRYATETKVNSGETVLLCGLGTPATRRFKDKVPVLGDIPLVGRLFRKEGEETYDKQLMLLVRVEKLEE